MKNLFVYCFVPAEVNSEGEKLFHNEIKIAKLFLRSLAYLVLSYKKSSAVKAEKIFRNGVDFCSTLWHPLHPKGHNFGGPFNAKGARVQKNKQGQFKLCRLAAGGIPVISATNRIVFWCVFRLFFAYFGTIFV